MSEPIELYHAETGKRFVTAAPSFADQLVQSGEYSRTPVVEVAVQGIEPSDDTTNDITEVDGVDADLAQILTLNHLHSKAAIDAASDEEILAVKGVGPVLLNRLRAWAEA